VLVAPLRIAVHPPCSGKRVGNCSEYFFLFNFHRALASKNWTPGKGVFLVS
jgi:hypothetical protein